MKSLYHAYEAYERRMDRGEFSPESTPKAPRQPLSRNLEIRLGEVLINAGLKLKRHAITGKSMAWSPLGGSQK